MAGGPTPQTIYPHGGAQGVDPIFEGLDGSAVKAPISSRPNASNSVRERDRGYHLPRRGFFFSEKHPLDFSSMSWPSTTPQGLFFLEKNTSPDFGEHVVA